MSGSREPIRCVLSLTRDQLDVLRQAQLRETVAGLQAAASDMAIIVDNFSVEFVPGEVAVHIRRVREDLDVLESLGYIEPV
jgi:hypothetical protein